VAVAVTAGALVSLASLTSGCRGTVEDGAQNPSQTGAGGTGAVATGAAGTGSVAMTGGAGTGAPTEPRPSLCSGGASDKPGYRMLRRLSQNEYNRTMRDALGVDATAFADIPFPGELARRGAFENYSDALSVDQTFIASLIDKTFDRAQALLAGPKGAAILVAPCVATAPNAACAEAMVRKYGYRMFRRPVTDAEVTSYVSLFTQGTTTAMLSAPDALAGVLAALMQSPKTLYISQLGAAAATGYKLDSYEIASVLAYGLTGTAPPVALLDRVGTGALDTPAGIAAEARALTESPAGQAHLTRFFQAWLKHDRVPFASKDPAVYNLPAGLTAAMVTESQMLIDDTYKAGGGIADLLLSPKTYVNKALATHYKWDAAGLTDGQFVERARPAGQGLGFLAQGAQLTRLGTSDSSSPTQRGVFMLNQLMCKELGQPPPVVPEIVPPSGQITTRERYEKVHGVAACSPCHARIDGVGFGFENFDGAGVYRTMEIGKPIDASGKILDLGGITFNGPDDLARKLAAAPEIGQCMAAQLTSYVYGVSVADALCIAPGASYPTAANPAKLGFKTVLEKVVTASHLTTRAN
jgi:hypothetical protein